MASFRGFQTVIIDPAPFPTLTGMSTSLGSPPQWPAYAPGLMDSPMVGYPARPGAIPYQPTTNKGVQVLSPADVTFFETIVIRPRIHTLGIILATQIIPVYIYNAYRYVPRVFNAFINNAGSGITITSLPTLPFTILRQDGLNVVLNVSADGAPIVNGTLDFDFDAFDISIPISGQRAVIFPFEPITPLTERMSFLTDVLERKNGTEQRISLRMNPRQYFDLQIEVEGNERRILDSVLFNSVGRPLGVPVWYEPSILTSAISIGAVTINVDSTAYADFRVNGLAMVFQDEERYEVLSILSLTATSITFKTAFTNAWAKNLRVMPVRIGFAVTPPRGEKLPLNLQRERLTVTIFDNESSLGSAAAFGTFDGKVFLDEGNAIDGVLAESWERKLSVFDGETGVFQVTSDWPNSRRSQQKTFHSRTRQRLWEVRQLLHYLRGRQTSFYIPTFYEELKVSENISGGSTTFKVENVGYAKFIQARPARNAIQVVKTDGTKIARKVLTAIEVSNDIEQLTVDSAFPSTIVATDILRIEYLEKVRLDSDEVTIRHYNGLGSAEASMPIIAVFE